MMTTTSLRTAGLQGDTASAPRRGIGSVVRSRTNGFRPHHKRPIRLAHHGRTLRQPLMHAPSADPKDRPAQAENNDDDKKKTQDENGGFTSEYYAGMMSSPLTENDRDEQLMQARDGLKQNLKFAGMSAGLIGGLLLGFMASNGLL